MERLPNITDELLDYLSRLYPDKCPEPLQTERDIWMNRGAAGVVRHLRMLHQDQHENMLGDLEDVLRKRP
jgi:hypothetical protein